MTFSCLGRLMRRAVQNRNGCSVQAGLTPRRHNVFDIQQGVSIGIFIKEAGKTGEAKVFHKDLWGKREQKYDWLNINNINSTSWEKVKKDKRNYPLKNTDNSLFLNMTILFRLMRLCLIIRLEYTQQETFTVGWNENVFKDDLKRFINIDTEEARNLFKIGVDSSDWAIDKAQKDIRINNGIESIQKFTYRPFDIRYTSYTGTTGGFLCRPRYETMKH